ncbi:MAG: hypothetical protein HXY34_10160 [Candidatus Thorarchaeota archaeon]|nr:hypothetical protein [Candidatus Thorarchaeota archaeon]
MSTDRTRVITPSTAEAIRMASAAIVGTMTGRGFPLGSAVGSGSMMEQNSETVAMSVAPIVFAIRDALRASEGLDILSMEWDLERTPGPEVLPEQLVVTGSASGKMSSQVCVLSWERGVADPFKVDEYIRVLSKKLSDVEIAVENSGLAYESEGLPVLRRFNDRLSRVFFVDLLDRRFQASWDSFQLKSDSVDRQLTYTLKYYEDFTTLPPGIQVRGRTSLSFDKSHGDEKQVIEHFKRRVLTPSGLEILSKRIPELGHSILAELNTYAYSPEEAEVVRAITEFLVRQLGRNTISIGELGVMSDTLKKLMHTVDASIATLTSVCEQHVKSGQTLSIDGHRAALMGSPQMLTADKSVRELAEGLVNVLVSSITRQFPSDAEVRAWRLGSVVSYFLAFVKRVASYYAGELVQYVYVSAARDALTGTLQDFRNEVLQSETDAVNRTLFEKFYDELQAQLNAVFARNTFRRVEVRDLPQLMSMILSEVAGVFSKIDIWSLVEFADLASIARSEIIATHSLGSADSSTPHLNPRGEALNELLGSLERIVFEVVPDLAATLLSKPFIANLTEVMQASGFELTTVLDAISMSGPEQSEDWKRELAMWSRELGIRLSKTHSAGDRLHMLLEYVHEKAGTGLSAHSMVDRVKSETSKLEAEYAQTIAAWESECRQVEEKNARIEQHNRRREELLRQTEAACQAEMRAYEAALREFQLHPTGEEPTQRHISRPTPPEPLESRTRRLEAEHPLLEKQPMPPRPQPPESLVNYRELVALLTERIEKMGEREEEMESKFHEKLKRLSSEASTAMTRVSVEIPNGFMEYVMNSVVRGLSRLLPRVTRVYLTNPDTPGLLYLVSYEYSGDEIRVTVGDTFLR